MKVNGQWVPCVRKSSYSFMPIALKLYMCYGHGLKICMWLGYNPRIIFCHIFNNLNLVIFFGHFSELIEGTLVCNFSYSLILIFLKLYRHNYHALKICMWFGYNPPINFCHFFHNLNLAIFRAF